MTLDEHLTHAQDQLLQRITKDLRMQALESIVPRAYKPIPLETSKYEKKMTELERERDIASTGGEENQADQGPEEITALLDPAALDTLERALSITLQTPLTVGKYTDEELPPLPPIVTADLAEIGIDKTNLTYDEITTFIRETLVRVSRGEFSNKEQNLTEVCALWYARSISTVQPPATMKYDRRMALIKRMVTHPYTIPVEATKENATKIKDLAFSTDEKRTVNILEKGKVKSIADLADCSRFEARETFLTKLGSGVDGSAYLVEVPERGEKVIKVLNKAVQTSTETSLLNMLDHPNIVKIHYAGNHFVRRDGSPIYAILMDYIDGKTLREIIQEHPDGMNAEEAAAYSLQLFDSIQHMRSQPNPTYHHDINPNNIKVDSSGRLVLLDFGIASSSETHMEDKNRRYGGSDDVFGWGMITYELFTGRHFIDERDRDESSRTFAERIKRMKGEMRNDDGSLTPRHVKKIREHIPKKLRKAVLASLESVDNEERLFEEIEWLREEKEMHEGFRKARWTVLFGAQLLAMTLAGFGAFNKGPLAPWMREKNLQFQAATATTTIRHVSNPQLSPRERVYVSPSGIRFGEPDRRFTDNPEADKEFFLHDRWGEQTEELETMIVQGTKLFNAGDCESAVEKMDAVRRHLQERYLEQARGLPRSMIVDSGMGSPFNTSDYRIHLIRGKCLALDQKTAEAREEFYRALRTYTDSELVRKFGDPEALGIREIYRAISDAEWVSGDTDRALIFRKHMDSVDSRNALSDASFWRLNGDLWAAQGENIMAIETYKRGMDVDPEGLHAQEIISAVCPLLAEIYRLDRPSCEPLVFKIFAEYDINNWQYPRGSYYVRRGLAADPADESLREMQHQISMSYTPPTTPSPQEMVFAKH